MRKTITTLLFTALFASAAHAEPVLSPLNDGGGVYTFHGLEKYQLFNAPTGLTHAGGTMRWHYNDANRPASITKANAIARIQASMAKWSASCRITFAYQGETSVGFSIGSGNYDGVNVVGWDATGLSAPTTGVTTIAWNGSNTVIDAEIRFNAAYGVTVSSFDSTAVHEVGHALGLQHSDVNGAVMSGPPSSSYNGMASLGSDDVAGCVRLYGAAGGAPSDTQAPSVPNGIIATAVSSTAINVNWNASTDNVGVTNYQVYRNGSSMGSVTSTGAAITNLSPSTSYSFTVAACDGVGNCSAQSAAASATTQAAPVNAPTAPSTGNYQDMWWSPGENGWGLTITQHGDKLFLAWYLYDAAGNPTWVVMSAGQWDPSRRTFMGDVYAPTGTWFGNYDASRFKTGAAAGAASVTFTSDSTGVLQYNVNGVVGSKPIARLAFGPVATPTATNYGDMWWAGSSENGWGLVLSHQYQTLFATWFTYDNAGQTTWFVMSNGTWASSNTYTGTLYRARGSAVIGSAYNPAAFQLTPVGGLTLQFNNAGAGTMTYTVDGVTQTKPISRFNF